MTLPAYQQVRADPKDIDTLKRWVHDELDRISLAFEDVRSGSAASGSVYSTLKAKGDIAAVSFSNVEAVLDWTQSFNSGTDVTLGASLMTINQTGTYKFTVTLRTVSNNRTELLIRTYISAVEDTDEIVSDYVARDVDQNTGAVTLITALQLTAGDTVQFRGEGDCDGTCTGLNAGTILLVERIA